MKRTIFMACGVLFAVSALAGTRSVVVERNFENLDTNNDGHLTQQELEVAPELSARWEEFDEDGNSRLDQGEFSAFETYERERSDLRESGIEPEVP